VIRSKRERQLRDKYPPPKTKRGEERGTPEISFETEEKKEKTEKESAMESKGTSPAIEIGARASSTLRTPCEQLKKGAFIGRSNKGLLGECEKIIYIQ